MCPSGLLAHRGPGNQTGQLVVGQGCDLYDFYSEFFDFFRIYYKVEGWEDIIRKLLFRMQLLYPQSRSTHASAASAERERTKDDTFFMQQLFMDRWKKSGDYFNLKWTSDPVVVPPSEWSLLVNASRCVRECAGVGVGVSVDMGVSVGDDDDCFYYYKK